MPRKKAEQREADEKLKRSIEKNRRAAKARMKKGEPPKVAEILKDDDLGIEPKGSPTSKCKICGKQFNQTYIEADNKYTSFKICDNCKAKQQREKEQEIEKNGGFEKSPGHARIKYQPYPWQEEAAEAFENHRFIVLSCGNRSGYKAPCIQ